MAEENEIKQVEEAAEKASEEVSEEEPEEEVEVFLGFTWKQILLAAAVLAALIGTVIGLIFWKKKRK